MNIGIGGIQFKRALQRAERGVMLIQVEQRNSQPHEYRGGGAGYRCGAPQRALSLGEIAQHQMRKPEIFERNTVAGLGRERLFQRRDGVTRAPRDEQGYREQDQRIGIARRALQHLLAQRLRAGGVSRLQAFMRLTELAL